MLIIKLDWPPAFGWTRTVPEPAVAEPRVMLPVPFANNAKLLFAVVV